MFLRAEQHGCSTSARRWLALGAVGALLLGSLGCGGEHESKGGANTPKARENRKVAEASVVEGVQVAAKEQVAHHAELKKQSMRDKFVSAIFPCVPPSPPAPSVPVAPTQPAAPPPPAAPKPPGVQPQITASLNSKGESPIRTAARQASPVVISERVVTDIPYPTEAEADARALEDAQKLIEKRLKELDPPVEYLPPIAVVKHEYVKRDSRLVRLPSDREKELLTQNSYSSDRKYVEYTVELSAEQVRELRTRNRVADALRGLGVIAAVSLAGFFFLRLDEWSKGYLTSWLALAAAALGGGIVAAVVFV